MDGEFDNGYGDEGEQPVGEGETAPLDSSTLRSRSLRVLGYTNNELTPEQRAGAITHVVDEVRAGRLTAAHQRVPLAEITDAWSRPGDRVVLVPEEV